MTTPLIEKKDFHMMALAKSGSAKEYGELTVVQLGYVTQLMEEAHQAGIEEAVLEIRKTLAFEGVLSFSVEKAIDNTIKALTDKK